MALPLILFSVAAAGTAASAGTGIAASQDAVDARSRDIAVAKQAARTRAADQELTRQRDRRATHSAQIAAAAASGVDPYGSASAAAVRDDTESEFARLADTIRVNRDVEILGLNARRKALRRAAMFEQIGIATEAATSIATGAFQGHRSGMFT